MTFEINSKNDENLQKTTDNDWIGWIPLEANENIWNNYIKELGIKGIKSVEIWSFDDHIPIISHPHYALILCYDNFREVKKIMEKRYQSLKNEIPDGVFFAQQKIKNACGTFALIHSITQNINKINIGNGIFANWYNKAKECAVEKRSDVLKNDENFSQLHKKTALNGTTSITESDQNPDSHYICYVIVNEHLYEFDSRMDFPRNCGLSSEKTLLEDAALECKKLISNVKNLNFSALAIISDN